MIYGVFSIRDTLNGFMSPIVEMNRNVAKRNFSYAVNNNDLMGFSPKDYDLYQVGEFDSEKGTINAFEFPEMIMRGTDAFGEGDING